MKKLNEKEIDKIILNTRATLEIEGLTPSKENDEIVKKFLTNEITEKQAKELVLKQYGIK